MRQTRIWHLLQGYRDRPPANLRCLAETLVRFSSLVASHAEIREIDINPLLVDESGVVALDARVQVVSERIERRVAMAVRPYPLQWMSEATIDGIGAIRIRPIRPEDEHLYVEFFARITAHDGRLRFFASAPSLSHRFVARLTQIDYAREMAFVAIARASGELLGVVRLIADPDYRRAEFAVLVRSDLKGRGLGWALMQKLISYARTEGLEELHGAVLAENTAMLSMCQELGFSIQPDLDDPTLRLVTVQLQSQWSPT
jgi:acetyltransferase